MPSTENNSASENTSLINEARDYFENKKDKIESDEKIRKKLKRLNNIFCIGLIPISVALGFAETLVSITVASAAMVSIILLITLLTYMGDKYRNLLLSDDTACTFYLYKSYIDLGNYLKSENPADSDSALSNFRKYCYLSDGQTDDGKEKFFKRIIDLSGTSGWFKVEPEVREDLEVFSNIGSKTEQSLSQNKNLPEIYDLLSNLLILYYLEVNNLSKNPQYNTVRNSIVELYRSLDFNKPGEIRQSKNNFKEIKTFFINSLGSNSLLKRIFSWFLLSILLTLLVKLVFIIFKTEVALDDLLFNVFVVAFTDGLAISYLAPIVFRKKTEKEVSN